MYNPHYKTAKKRLLVTFVTTGIIFAGLFWAWMSRQTIVDTYRVNQYQVPAEVSTLADQTTMTDEGRKIFYTTHPDIANQEDFNKHCRQGNASEYSIVLGCYITNNQLFGDIYLYNINDARLNGVVQVTAAHEMLHAAYDRLSKSEKQRIDKLLLQAYDDLPDERIKQTIAQYEANDPASVPSELHSILGTELADLNPELEAYYARYFSNRKAIVAFSQQYEGEFTRREEQVNQYDQQLAKMKLAIEASQNEIDSRLTSLNSQKSELESLQAQGDIETYNYRVNGFNYQVNSYNALVQQTRADIEEYNRIVKVRNDLALEVEQLTQAINSRPQTL